MPSMNARIARVAVLAAATAALAPASALARHLEPDKLGPETRVGVINEADEVDVGARDDSSAESHRGISLEGCEVVVGSRWYLTPEPILRNPKAAVAYAYTGHSLPAYSYALNNPIRYWDANGACPMCLILGGAAIVMMWNDDTSWNGGGGAIDRLGPAAVALTPLVPPAMSALSWQAKLAIATGGQSVLNRGNACMGRNIDMNLSRTVGNQLLDRPYVNSNSLANWVFQNGTTIGDPQGVVGRTLTVANGSMSTAVGESSLGQYEVLMNESSNTIEHFLFTSH
jgi:hypothetical protein